MAGLSGVVSESTPRYNKGVCMRDLVIALVFLSLVAFGAIELFKELATVKTNVHKILTNK